MTDRPPPAPSQPDLPSYAELASADPPGSSWSVWGERFALGSLNHLRPDAVRAAASQVRTGQAYPLGLSLDAIDPPLYGRSPGSHRLTNDYDAPYHDDILDNFNTQASSQWDGLRHARHPAYGWYGGVPEERHGVQHWAARTITGRGVLVDVDRWYGAQGRAYSPDQPQAITPADVDAAMADQGVEPEPGDILCLRTGWLSWYRGLDQEGRIRISANVTAAGLAPGRETLAWLWDRRFAALAADNPAVEPYPFGSTLPAQLRAELAADPTRADELCLHQSAIPLLGLVLGEQFDLDALARDCAADNRWEFLFVAAPMGLPGGAASPANAVAIR